MDISLEQYRVFYQVSRHGSITAAAKVLCVSQPAVSQSLQHLEDALGCELFVRTPKGVRLTQAGELLDHYVSRGIDSILAGEDIVKKMNNLEEGEVRIGASDMTLQFFLLSYLGQFHQDHPKLKVSVTNGPTPETLEMLAEGRIDFGVVTMPFVHRPELQVFPIRQVRDCFVAGPQFAHLQDQILDYGDLAGMPLIFLEKGTSTRRYIDQYLEARNITLRPEFELATSDMIIQFAAKNLGIGCVMRDFAKERLERGEIFELRFREEIPKRDMCLVTDRRSPLSPAARRLLDMITGHPLSSEACR